MTHENATDGDHVSGVWMVVSINGACTPSHIIIPTDPQGSISSIFLMRGLAGCRTQQEELDGEWQFCSLLLSGKALLSLLPFWYFASSHVRPRYCSLLALLSPSLISPLWLWEAYFPNQELEYIV